MANPPKSEPVTSAGLVLFLPTQSSTPIPTREIQNSLFKLLSDEAAARGVNYVVDNMATIHNATSNSAQASAAPASTTNELTEAELLKMENSLRDMYQQIRALRTTMPRLVGAFAEEGDSPQSLHKRVGDAAVTGNNQLKKFTDTMKDTEIKKIFEHCEKSRAENPNGITPWRITQDPNWNKKL